MTYNTKRLERQVQTYFCLDPGVNWIRPGCKLILTRV